VNPWRETPTLAGGHVTLRPLSLDDKPALIEAAAAGNLWDTFYANVAQLKDADAWFAATLRERDYGRAMPFAVIANNQLVGTTRLMRLSEQHRRVEIGGTFYAKAVQRTGVNTEAKLLLLTHAFEAMNCQCVQIRTDFLNKRSQAAIERLGARQDGILRGHQIVAGRLRDTVVYSILDREWEGVRRNLQFLLARGERKA
jgi:RimJ/RimL family protein N-acetyltransferase